MGEPQKKHLLVVEDHQLVRRMAVTMLENADFVVTAATQGEEAIELVRANLTPIDCAVVDRTMPGMGGLAVVEELRRLRPALPIVLMSGYVPAATESAAVPGRTDFLQKPFTADALVAKVRALIDTD